MKKSLLLLFLLSFYFLNAQLKSEAPWMTELNKENRATHFKFQEIVDAFDTYWETRDPNAKGSGYKPFKRWEYYWQHFVNEDGYLPTSAELWNAWLEKEAQSQFGVEDDESSWVPMGPSNFLNRPTSSANLGRVNVVIKDPNNSNIYYVGAPAGGIWKSIDTGLSWTPLIDDLPRIGVSGIAIDYNNSDIIYIATGDDDSFDALGVGVYKSTDGGLSWNETDLNPGNAPQAMNDIYIHPTDSNVLWVASTDGLFKTTDGGDIWTPSLAGNIRDIKIKPGDPSVVYAVSSSLFYKSTDGGDNFDISGTGLPDSSGRLVIDVTPANAEVVYVVSAGIHIPNSDDSYKFQGIYKSTDSGDTFIQKANTVNIFEITQAWYDLALAVSDTDEDEVYVGVLNIWKSVNGGDSFSKLNNWFVRNTAYTHADIHFLRFYDNELYAGTDGGFFKSSNGGATFADLSTGLEISQFYRISVSQQTSNKIAGGTQDNGGFAYFNQWNNYHGGDGMESVIDPNNDNMYYGFIQYGRALYISSTSGQGSSTGYEGPEDGEWVTPLAINSESEVYAGYSSLYQFTGTWTAISPSFGSDIDALEIDPNEPDNMYVAINKSLRKSTDRGVSFTSTETFPTNITSIEVNNNDSDIIYITTSGTSNGKIYKSTDAGENFSDITGTLPDLAKIIIKHQGENLNNPLYLGTSVGVYRYADDTGVWEPFDNGLPNTTVSDLAINLPDNNITAGTYGRSIWRSDLPPVQLAPDDVKLLSINHPGNDSILCGDVSPQITVKNNGANAITNIDGTYNIDDGTDIGFNWNGSLASGETTTIDFDIGSLALGEHDFNVIVNIANDAFAGNNNAFASFFTNKNGISETVNSFETEDDELIAYNAGGGIPLWERGVPTGIILNTPSSGTSVYGTNLAGNHPDETLGYLVSHCYDLTAIVDPIIKFDMAFIIEQDWDLVYMQYSIDQGGSWSLLGSAADPNWYNSSRIAGDGLADDCYNCVGGQWTGTNITMTEYSYDLAPLSVESTVIFRFVFHSDPAVNEEGAIIDDFYIDGMMPDDDNDGVPNVTDNCVSQANPDQLDTDNDGQGDVCDEDDDNDGVLDGDDNCPLTANADQADDNNDNIGNVCDTDNDGILNEEDNCPNTANTDQADTDNDGEGDVCDEDVDNDGVPNSNDNCNDTPLGDIVDSNGCTVFTLPTDNFQIQVTSETCRNSNNGSVSITTNEILNYSVNLSGEGLDTDNAFSDAVTISDLEAGNYRICITVDSDADYEQCYNITITEPENLAVFSTIINSRQTVSLDLSGGDMYYIELNGNVFSTTESTIELDLKEGVNTLKVSTNLECQGIYSETISNFSRLKIYPNPVSGTLTIYSGNSELNHVGISLYSMIGTVVMSDSYPLQNGIARIELPGIAKGVYLLHVDEGSKTATFKLIKQ